MFNVTDLRCERDGRVLFASLNFSLSPGILLQVEGANGAGKSTLLRVLAGLSSDYQGHVFWKNKPLKKVYADFRLSTFYFGHKPGLKSDLTALENIRWRSRLRNELYTPDQITEALSQVDLAGYADVVCGHLSAGQHRRVALADLSLTDASLWVLDEPFTAIDVAGVVWLEQLLHHHTERGGLVIMTSHQKLSKLSGRVEKLKLEDFVTLDRNDRAGADEGILL